MPDGAFAVVFVEHSAFSVSRDSAMEPFSKMLAFIDFQCMLLEHGVPRGDSMKLVAVRSTEFNRVATAESFSPLNCRLDNGSMSDCELQVHRSICVGFV